MNFEVNNRPEVSVIIPVYNNEKFIRETLESLKNQTFADFEALCIDDGSSDGSAKIIQEYEANDQRFHYIYQKNSGAGPARNNGLSNAKGEYIAFLDGDDLYYPNYLKRMIEALDKTQADVCICERESFDSKSGRTIYRGSKYKKFEEDKVYYTKDLANNFFELISVFCWDKMFRHSFLERYPYEFQNLRSSNDVTFVCSTMAAAQTVCFVKESMVRYRNGTGVSTQDRAIKYPLCAMQAFGIARKNIYHLHEGDITWQKTIDSRCAEAFFNTIQKDVKDEASCKEAYDTFKNQFEIEWKFREKPLRYSNNNMLRLKMWCYRRTSYNEMRKVYLKLHKERGEKKHIFERVLPYGAMVISGLLKR